MATRTSAGKARPRTSGRSTPAASPRRTSSSPRPAQRRPANAARLSAPRRAVARPAPAGWSASGAASVGCLRGCGWASPTCWAAVTPARAWRPGQRPRARSGASSRRHRPPADRRRDPHRRWRLVAGPRGASARSSAASSKVASVAWRWSRPCSCSRQRYASCATRPSAARWGRHRLGCPSAALGRHRTITSRPATPRRPGDA